MKNFILASSVFFGTIVGAGIFALPYTMSQSGLATSIGYFVVVGGAVLLLHLFFGEVCLRTREKHRLIGYAQIYLGKTGKWVASVAVLIVLGGALLAYIIIGGEFLKIVVGPFLPFSSFGYSLLFWGVLSICIFFGMQLIARLELLMNAGFLFAVALVFLLVFPQVNLANFDLFRPSQFFLPYGVLFFAFVGWDAIPEVAELFKGKKDKRNLDNVIVWTSLIVGGLYFLFSFFVVGVSGKNTTPDALTGLAGYGGGFVARLGALFGLLAIASSFLILGNYLKNSLRYDFHIPVFRSVLLATAFPLALFLLGLNEFIEVIGVVGALMAAIEGVLIILIFKKAKRMGDREPEYAISCPAPLLYALAVFLIGGGVAYIVIR